MTTNMVGPSSTPNKSKGKQLAVSSEESNVDRSPRLKDALVELEGVYRCTWTRTVISTSLSYFHAHIYILFVNTKCYYGIFSGVM